MCIRDRNGSNQKGKITCESNNGMSRAETIGKSKHESCEDGRTNLIQNKMVLLCLMSPDIMEREVTKQETHR